MTDISVYLDFCVGDREAHAQEQSEYDATAALLAKNATIYGLPASPADLSEEQQQILSEIDVLDQHFYCAHAGRLAPCL